MHTDNQDPLTEAIYRAAEYGTGREPVTLGVAEVRLPKGGTIAADMVPAVLELFGPEFLDGAVIR